MEESRLIKVSDWVKPPHPNDCLGIHFSESEHVSDSDWI